MRLWTLHPSTLDTPGLTALWREALGAQKALFHYELGQKVGYQNHPQLERFKQTEDPLATLVAYMHEIHAETIRRKYNFNKSLIMDVPYGHVEPLPVTSEQVEGERKWLASKLLMRSPDNLHRLVNQSLHPLFYEVEGDVESWEKTDFDELPEYRHLLPHGSHPAEPAYGT